ncbi:MAG: YfhO family protein [Chloroflexi bacterium]|nr:YfhO family protein [Chloroflexota bacterium]
MPSPSRRTFLHLGVLIGLWARFFWRFAAPNPADRWAFVEGDFTQQFGVFRDLVYRPLAAGQFPLWAGCLLSGYPLHADPQTALFYFPAWITYGVLRLMGWGNYPIEALTAEVLAHYLLASILMYAFLRRELTRPMAALFGAVVFTYGGYLTGFPALQTATLETETWLPLLLLCLRRLAHTRRLKHLALASAVLAVAYFAGHPQTFVFVGMVSVAYLVFQSRQSGIRWGTLSAWAAGFGFLTAGLAAVQLLPSLQFIGLSTRAGIPFSTASRGFPFQDIAQFFITGLVSHWQPLYLGILPLALAVWAALRHPRPHARFWTGVAVTGLILSFGTKAVAYDAVFWLVPLFKLFRGQEHFSFVVVFALSVLAAYGADSLLGPLTPAGRRALNVLRNATLLLFAVAIVFLLATLLIQRANLLPDPSDTLPVRAAMWTLFALLGSMALHARLRWPAARHWMGALLLTVAVLDLFAVNRGADVAPPYQPYPYSSALQPVLAEPGFFRVQDDFQLKGHAGCGYGFRQVEGITPYLISTYGRLIDEVAEPVRWKLLGVRFVVTWRQELIAGDGSRPTAEEVAQSPAVPGVPNKAGITKVFRLTAEGDPKRAFVAHDVRVASDAAVFARLSESGFDPFATAYVSAAVAAAPGGPGESVTAQSDAPGHLQLRVNTAAPGLLVISEAYFPGWQARVNGAAASVLRADGALLAVAVGPGESLVALDYRPPVLLLGGAVSITALLVCVALIIWPRFGWGK